jgi:hypothetical protein
VSTRFRYSKAEGIASLRGDLAGRTRRRGKTRVRDVKSLFCDHPFPVVHFFQFSQKKKRITNVSTTGKGDGTASPRPRVGDSPRRRSRKHEVQTP